MSPSVYVIGAGPAGFAAAAALQGKGVNVTGFTNPITGVGRGNFASALPPIGSFG